MLVLLALQFAVLPVAAAARSNEPDLAKVDAFITSEMQSSHLPGLALGIVHNDQVVHLRGFGVADTSGRAVTPQTPFLIGSTSKSITALAILQLVEAGKISLDAPVQRYLPWFHMVGNPTASAHITVRHLLNQTSGLPTFAGLPKSSGLSYVTDETVEQAVRDLSTVALDRPVGSTFEYSNANYMVLGLLVQTVSGQAYETYIQQHIFDPLGMHHSFVSGQAARRDHLAQGYEWLFGLPFPVNEPLPRSLMPAGVMFSSAEDMSHYLVAQMNGGHSGSVSLLSPTGIATMHTPVAVSDAAQPGSRYGMGWFIGPQGGVQAIYHPGDTNTFNALMLIEPQNRWGAILLMNLNSAVAGNAIAEIDAGVASLLAGREPSSAGFSLNGAYLPIDGVLALISILVLWPLLRLPWWSKKLERRQQRRQHPLVRVILPLLRELVLPLILLLAIRPGPSFLFKYPDLGSWLLVMLALLLITGIIRVVLAFRILRRKRADTRMEEPAPPSTSPSLT